MTDVKSEKVTDVVLPVGSSRKKGMSFFSSLSSMWSYVICGMDKGLSPAVLKEPLSRDLNFLL